MLSLLLTVPSCIYSFWHGVIPTSYFIFNDFYPGLALTVARGEMPYIVRALYAMRARTRMHILCAQIKTEVITCMCNQDKMESV